MNKEIFKEILYLIIAIIIGVIAVKFMIWLLPVVMVMIVAFFIYLSLRNRGNKNVKKEKNIKLIHDDDVDGK